jgi:phosphoribosyl-AMP cyclohydrolase
MNFAARDSKESIEKGLALAPKFDKDGLIPVITQDAHSGEVLMLAYMNEETLKMTLQIGQAVYYSRSRQEVWHKGATSGQYQQVVELRVDCDQDAIVLRVDQRGSGCCHTGACSCFYRHVPLDVELAKEGIVPLVRRD